jgi:hypothetical protein
MKQLITFIFAATLAVATVGQASAVEPKEPSKAEIKKLIQTANTPAAHMRIASYFHHEAVRLEAEAADHVDMGAAYDKNKMQYLAKTPTMGDHCRTWEKLNREAAKEANDMAAMHEAMAKGGK